MITRRNFNKRANLWTKQKGGIIIQYVYHMVPNNMVGNNLIALNKLKENNEELYNSYAKKYSNHPERIKLLERNILKLNCLWNDVVHFLPLNPNYVYEALTTVGIKVASNLRFYKIPIENLVDNKNAIYLYRKENYKGPAAPMNSQEVKLLDTRDYQELTSIPKDTVDYYMEEHSKGNKFGIFPFIPHVLSYGEVSIANAEIINWSKKID